MSAEFFKIKIARPAGDPAWPGGAWWVERAEKLRETPTGGSYFGHTALTDDPSRAAVYFAEHAEARLRVLRNNYPTAELVPADFQEWVLSPDISIHQ